MPVVVLPALCLPSLVLPSLLLLHVVCTGADSLPAPLFALIVAVQDAAEWRQATDEQRAELMRTRAEATSLARQLQAAEPPGGIA